MRHWAPFVNLFYAPAMMITRRGLQIGVECRRVAKERALWDLNGKINQNHTAISCLSDTLTTESLLP